MIYTGRDLEKEHTLLVYKVKTEYFCYTLAAALISITSLLSPHRVQIHSKTTLVYRKSENHTCSNSTLAYEQGVCII